MRPQTKKRFTIMVAAGAALASLGAVGWKTTRVRRVPAPTSIVTQEAAVHAPPRLVAAATASEGTTSCADGFVAGEPDRCTPVDPATGAPFTASQLARFDQIRASRAVGSKNFFVPRVMTAAESQRRAGLFAEMNALRTKILGKSATAEEIDTFFNFRERINAYRMQLVTQQHIEGGGRITSNDPVLDVDDILDPAIRNEHAALTEEAHRDELARRQARLDHGLPADAVLLTAGQAP